MKVKRSGFVYSLYRKNILHLWLLTVLLLAIVGFLLIHHQGASYLMNYLVYRSEPNVEALTAYTERDMLDRDTVLSDIQKNGGEDALLRQRPSCFFRPNLYQEGSRYRFSIPIDREKLTDTGIYYDNLANVYTGIPTDGGAAEVLKERIPKDNYVTDHLYFYEYGGVRYLLVMDYETDWKEKMRVTFAPLGVYALYMVYDLYQTGETAPLCNYFIDCRGTPVDPEDEIFKDLCMISPFALAALVAAILLTVFPGLHPTYRQLSKYGRTVQKAAENVDADYEEYGIECEDKKTIYLNDWLVKKSCFKNGIEKNYKKQRN